MRELAFPSEDEARERARELFGIDIESSLREWFLLMGIAPERVRELAARPSTNGKFGPGRAHDHDDELVLTGRQREALAYVACGYTRAQAGKMMGVGGETVKRHLDNARYRLRAATAAQAVLIAALIGELDTGIVQRHLLRLWE